MMVRSCWDIGNGDIVGIVQDPVQFAPVNEHGERPADVSIAKQGIAMVPDDRNSPTILNSVSSVMIFGTCLTYRKGPLPTGCIQNGQLIIR